MIYVYGGYGNNYWIGLLKDDGNIDSKNGYLHPNGKWSHGFGQDCYFNSRRNAIRVFRKIVGHRKVFDYIALQKGSKNAI